MLERQLNKLIILYLYFFLVLFGHKHPEMNDAIYVKYQFIVSVPVFLEYYYIHSESLEPKLFANVIRILSLPFVLMNRE